MYFSGVKPCIKYSDCFDRIGCGRMYKDIITVYVELDGFYEVHSEKADIALIPFHGTFSTELFDGVILPGGVDTQIQKRGQVRGLSARYILKGEYNGKTQYIFIENNGNIENDEIKTMPKVYTDCEELKYLEDTRLSGTVEGNGEGKVVIHIFENDNDD